MDCIQPRKNGNETYLHEFKVSRSSCATHRFSAARGQRFQAQIADCSAGKDRENFSTTAAPHRYWTFATMQQSPVMILSTCCAGI